MIQCINLTIRGKVQGVGFRYSVKMMADKFGIKGYVQNLPNGHVFIEAEGDKDALIFLENWCRTGPTRARVENISKDVTSVKKYNCFEIR